MKIGNKILLSFLVVIFAYVAFFIVREYMLSAVNVEFSNIIPLSNQSLALSEQINSLNALESKIDSYIVIGSEELKITIKGYSEEVFPKISTFIEDENTRNEFGFALYELDESINSLIKINEQSGNKFSLNNQILRVYESIDKLKVLEKGLLEHRAEELHKIIIKQQETTSRITKLSLFSGILVFIIGFFLFYLLSQNITKSITKLRDAAGKVSQGKLDTKIDVKSSNEIGQLAKAFSQMINDLKESRAKLEKYSKTLEQKVKVRTKELEEKNIEYERINKLVIGRELIMIELKKEIDKLKKKLGEL